MPKIKFSILDKSIVRFVHDEQIPALILSATHGIMGTGEDATAATMESLEALYAGKEVVVGMMEFQLVD